GIEPVEELHHGATLEELGHLIGESHENGALPRDTATLLDHALEFSERTLHEVMVPRRDAVFLRGDAGAEEAVRLIAAHGHSNYPVLGDHPDDVTGVIGVRELMALPAAELAGATAAGVARSPCCCRTPWNCRTRSRGCASRTTSSPSSSTSTAASRASSPTRTSPRSWSGTSPTRATPSRSWRWPTATAGWWTPAAGWTRSPRRPASGCPRRTTTRRWPV